MLSFPFWAAFALVFFGLKWLAESWIALPGPKRAPLPASPRSMRRASPPSPEGTETLREAA